MGKLRPGASLRYLRCPACALVLTATKVKGVTDRGHIKDLYCPKCRAVRKFEQFDRERIGR